MKKNSFLFYDKLSKTKPELNEDICIIHELKKHPKSFSENLENGHLIM